MRALLRATAPAVVALIAAVVFGGAYDVAATSPHWSITYNLVHWIGIQSIRRRARTLDPPVLSPAEGDQGLLDFESECVRCHGAPGRPAESFALGMTPSPPALQPIGREWEARDIYWVVAHGVKMTGMPAFEFRMAKRRIWGVVAAVRLLPMLTPRGFDERVSAARSRAGRKPPSEEQPPATGPADPERGRIALSQYGCSGCHAIPGLPGGADATTGPPLGRVGRRRFIAGVLDNNDAALAAWIQNPRDLKPETAMPDLGVGDRDVRDIVAYLRALR